MRIVRYRGRDYRCPLSDRFRRHTPEEMAALRDSLAVHGVYHPVRLFRLPGEPGQYVLDGEGRLEAAGDGVDVPMIDAGEMSLDDAYAVALSLNDARRHEDPKVVRERRKKRVAELRAKGMSVRNIAGELGIDSRQVGRDLAAAGVDSVHTSPSDPSADSITPRPAPPKVRGRDGKQYAAKRPQAKPAQPPAAGPDADPELPPPPPPPANQREARRLFPGVPRGGLDGSVAMVAATEAINSLCKIPRTDPRRRAGYEKVRAFIEANIDNTV